MFKLAFFSLGTVFLSANHTNFDHNSTNKTNFQPAFNLTIPLNLFNNETVAALNGTVFTIANGTNATTIQLNPNDPDSSDLRYLLSSGNSSCTRPHSDYLLLSIQWPVVLCSTGYCKSNSKQNWTLHGFWPSVRDYPRQSNAEYCCNREAFNESKLEPLRHRLSVSFSRFLNIEFIY